MALTHNLKLTHRGVFPTLAYSLQELIRASVYLGVAVLIAIYAPKRLLAYFAPFGVIAIVRLFGWNYTEAMAIATYSVVAVAAIPKRLERGWKRLLIPLGIFHLLLNLNTP